ncbi:MAG: hypothetical protein FWE39_20965, partial [Nocardiaceae bacterium]|nr:hypothetical protein [Nocardiaceae bacterium]
ITEREPELKPRLDDIVEIALRLGLSVVVFDDEAVHTDDDLRRFLTRWLEPAMTLNTQDTTTS